MNEAWNGEEEVIGSEIAYMCPGLGPRGTRFEPWSIFRGKNNYLSSPTTFLLHIHDPNNKIIHT